MPRVAKLTIHQGLGRGSEGKLLAEFEFTSEDPSKLVDILNDFFIHPHGTTVNVAECPEKTSKGK